VRRSDAGLAALVALLTMVALPGCPSERSKGATAATAPDATAPPASAPTAIGAALADVAERSVGSVVNISSERVVQTPGGPPGPFSDPFFRRFFGEGIVPEVPRERRETSLGSGVIVSRDGVVLTNHHVVQQGQEILVTLSDGRTLEAEVVGSDPPSDLAVLRLSGGDGALAPLPSGASSRLRLGQMVLAIGNPFGVGQTVTMGIVSATGRADLGIADYEDFIQTDAAINPGNSGGALVDAGGRLVGINTAIASRTGGYQGVGFAIPSDMARAVMASLLETGRVDRGWLGVVIQPITPELADALELDDARGVLVSDVAEASPAAAAGLEPGDVIVRLEGEPVTSSGDLRNRIAAAGSAREVALEVLRDGEPRRIEVRLGELPRPASEPAFAAPAATSSEAGLRLAPLDAEARRVLGIPDTVRDGVVVAEVAPGSPAERAGLRSGDVILEIDREPVRSADDFARRYAAGDDSLLLAVQRGEVRVFVPLRKPG